MKVKMIAIVYCVSVEDDTLRVCIELKDSVPSVSDAIFHKNTSTLIIRACDMNPIEIPRLKDDCSSVLNKLGVQNNYVAIENIKSKKKRIKPNK